MCKKVGQNIERVGADLGPERSPHPEPCLLKSQLFSAISSPTSRVIANTKIQSWVNHVRVPHPILTCLKRTVLSRWKLPGGLAYSVPGFCGGRCCCFETATSWTHPQSLRTGRRKEMMACPAMAHCAVTAEAIEGSGLLQTNHLMKAAGGGRV